MTFKLGESIKVTSIYYLDTTRINTCVWERGNTFLLITALFVKMSFADFTQLFFHQCLLDPLISHWETIESETGEAVCSVKFTLSNVAFTQNILHIIKKWI